MAGIPSTSIDLILDFIAGMFIALVTTFFEVVLLHTWNAFVFIFVTMAQDLAFLWLIAIFLFMFHKKYIEIGS